MCKGLLKPIPSKVSTRATKRLGQVFVGLSGTNNVPAPDSKQYTKFVRDNYSRKPWADFLGRRSDIVIAFKRFLADTVTGRNGVIVRSDGDADFEGKFRELCDEHQIIRKFTTTNSPQPNGVAEQFLGRIERRSQQHEYNHRYSSLTPIS